MKYLEQDRLQCIICCFSVYQKRVILEGCRIMLSKAYPRCFKVPPTSVVGCCLCFGTEPLCSFPGSSSLPPLCNSLPVCALACSFCLWLQRDCLFTVLCGCPGFPSQQAAVRDRERERLTRLSCTDRTPAFVDQTPLDV